MICQRTLVFGPADSEAASLFSDSQLAEQALRKLLPPSPSQSLLVVDLARTSIAPHPRPGGGNNFLFDPAHGQIRPLSDDQLIRHLPLSHPICRVYAEDDRFAPEITAALDRLLGPGGADDVTNM